MTKTRSFLILLLLLTVCFTVATCLEPAAVAWTRRGQSDGVLTQVLGDAQRMFANHFFVKADVYFHRGYYPSIFEQGQKQAADAKHMMGEHDEEDEHQHEQEMDFLGRPKDWIDRFGRNFYPSTHSHLDKPGEAREILPWLRISADLDPWRIETYIVASYWLRQHLGRVDEAQQFLREGLRANPRSYEILFELGKLEYENKQDATRARNLWEAALRNWREQDAAAKNHEPLAGDDILAHLAHLEEEQGNLSGAINYLEQQEKVSPQPDVIRHRIDELKQKMPK
jgi:tetratricopeptide (TPR) repeat protein